MVIALLFFSFIISLTNSLTPTSCGKFTPAAWFNLNTNDQITIEFGVPGLNSEIVIPYLYGCRPLTAVMVSGSENITFQYNTQGLVTYSKYYDAVPSTSSMVNVSYFKSDTTQDYWFFAATYITGSTVFLNTFTDDDDRIVTIETSAFYQGTGPYHPPHHHGGRGEKNHKPVKSARTIGSVLRRSIQAPLGDMNYYYQGPYLNLMSTLNVAWNGIEQVTYGYTYSITSNLLTNLNVSTSLFQDNPFYVNYSYYYDSNGVMNYYCVNSCNDQKIIFGYDTLGRLVNSTSGQDVLLLLSYDTNGNANSIQSGGVAWTLTY